MKEKSKEFIKKGKWLRSALLTLILIIVILTIYVGLNLLVRKLDLADIDVTQDKLYSLSQESKDKVKNITQDTKIILYGMSNYPEVEQFAKLYSNENSHISYEILTDPSTRTDLQTEYVCGGTIFSFEVEFHFNFFLSIQVIASFTFIIKFLVPVLFKNRVLLPVIEPPI